MTLFTKKNFLRLLKKRFPTSIVCDTALHACMLFYMHMYLCNVIHVYDEGEPIFFASVWCIWPGSNINSDRNNRYCYSSSSSHFTHKYAQRERMISNGCVWELLIGRKRKKMKCAYRATIEKQTHRDTVWPRKPSPRNITAFVVKSQEWKM